MEGHTAWCQGCTKYMHAAARVCTLQLCRFDYTTSFTRYSVPHGHRPPQQSHSAVSVAPGICPSSPRPRRPAAPGTACSRRLPPFVSFSWASHPQTPPLPPRVLILILSIVLILVAVVRSLSLGLCAGGGLCGGRLLGSCRLGRCFALGLRLLLLLLFLIHIKVVCTPSLILHVGVGFSSDYQPAVLYG